MKHKTKILSMTLSIFLMMSLILSPVVSNSVLAQEIQKEKVRVIVEFKGNTALDEAKRLNLSIKEAVKLSDKIKLEQKPLIEKIKNYGGEIVYTYQCTLNGASVNVDYSNIEKLEQIPEVKKVSLTRKYYPALNTSANIIDAEEVWNKYKYKGEGTVVSIIDTGIDYNHNDMRISDSSKVKFKERDITGGIGKYFTEKVPYGYNFADNNYNVIDTTNSMHGMHVAGIVAANSADNSGLKGVAPEAQLLAMKVFSNDPKKRGAESDAIAAAIEDSIRHGADVINMSLGTDAGFLDPNDPEQAAIRRAVDAGVIVVVAGGNAGYSTSPHSPYIENADTAVIGSPGLYNDAIQVASMDNLKSVSKAFRYESNSNRKGLIAYAVSGIEPEKILSDNYGIVDCKYGSKEDFGGQGLNNKIALIKKGEINLKEKQINAQEAGAIAIIIYNSDGDDSFVEMPADANVTIPSIFIGNTDGEKLKNLISDNVTIKFTNDTVQISNSKYKMSGFSSWGTAPDLSFKPEVTAPGGNIYSTINDNQYCNMSGTSMASPHAAGAMALLVQHLKDNNIINGTDREFVETAKDILINTSTPIIDAGTDGLPYLTRSQGAGLISIERALKNRVVATDEEENAVIALKEIGQVTDFKIKLKNLSDREMVFKVQDKYGVLTNENFYSDTLEKTCITMKAERLNGASLQFTDGEVIVPANGETEINVTLNISESTLPDVFVEGFITLASYTSQQPSLVIPYMGFYGEWDKVRILDEPVWSKDSFYKLAALTDKTGFYLGTTKENNKYIVKPEYISISPNGDEEFDETYALISFLRNAKEFKVQVLDENKEIIKEIANEKNIRKNFNEDTFPRSEWDSKIKWSWDGKVKGAVVDEGQYYLRFASIIDYPGAEFQNLDMPIKVDLTPPQLEVAIDKINNSDYKINFNGTDNVGIYKYYICFDDSEKAEYEFYGYINEEIITVPEDITKLTITAQDYAGNKVSKNSLERVIKFDKNNPEDLTVSTGLSEITSIVDETGYSLILDKDYKVNNRNIIIKKEYMQNIELGNMRLNVNSESESINIFIPDNCSDDALLKDIKIDGKSLIGFDNNTMEYYYEISPFKEDISVVTVEKNDEKASVKITQCEESIGTALIEVKSESEKVKKQFKIKIAPAFVAKKSQDNFLRDGMANIIKMELANNHHSSVSAEIMFTMIDYNGKVIKVVKETETLNGKEEKEFEYKVNVPNGVSEIKCYVWDGIDSMNPISKEITFDVY